MSSNRKTIGQWLTEKFSGSHKAISEKLSAEEYSAFTAEAGALQPAQEEEGSEAADDEDPKPDAGTGEITLEQRVAALEASLNAEKKKGTQLQAKLNETENKLQQAETQKAKLRQAVNPLGAKDAADADASDEPYLTAADQEARQAWKDRQA